MSETTKHIDPGSPACGGSPDDFMLRVAQALSDAWADDIFADLARAAAELLGADAAYIGRRVDVNGVPSIETLAFHADGAPAADARYALAGTPCDTVVGETFRIYPGGVSGDFSAAPAGRAATEAYAAFPLSTAAEPKLGLFAVLSARPLPDAARVESLLTIFSERVIAELRRIRAEDEVKAGEERYREIFNASVDGLALLSPEGRIVDINPAIERLYGYDRLEMVGQKALRFARGPSRENAARFLETVRDENYAVMVDKARHRDGSEFYIEPRGVTVNYRGRPHILAIIRDVTERVLAENERSVLEAQLRQAQKMEAIGHLTGGVAHDFNNILTSVLGYVELAHDHVEVFRDDQLNRYLERARRSGERARDLIQQMLTFTRGQQGEPRATSIGAVVSDTVALLESMVPATIRISTSVEPGLPAVIVDPVHVEQVMINLCLNARDAMPDGGALEIVVESRVCRGEPCSACHAETQGHFIGIVVRDAGIGMDAELVERIFEPFFSTKETGKGSGMGLSTVHGIVHEYGGHILVDSTAGAGTTVTVLLPAANGEPALADERDNRRGESAGVPRFEGEVLLVDDNAEVAEFVADLLGDWGLDVTSFQDAEAALKHFLARPEAYSFAILDQTMPTVTGVKLSRLMLNERPGFPIVLYSGYADDVDDGSVREAGIRALLQKPIDIERLRAIVGDLLAGQPH